MYSVCAGFGSKQYFHSIKKKANSDAKVKNKSLHELWLN